jgi:hypothetical protein
MNGRQDRSRLRPDGGDTAVRRERLTLRPVARRIWIVARGNGVLVADLAVASVDHDLATASVSDYLPCTVDSLGLGVVMTAPPRRVRRCDVPASVGTLYNVPVLVAHRFPFILCGCSGRRGDPFTVSHGRCRVATCVANADDPDRIFDPD